MNKFAISILLVTLASSSAFAQSKTRAEVYQELVEAQANGLNYITDTSYPDVNPVYAKVVEQMQQQHLAQQNAAKVTSNGN
jgi:hypothetical protein